MPDTTEADIQKALKLARTIISVKPGSLHTTEMETRSIARALIACREPVPITLLPGATRGVCQCGDTPEYDARFCEDCGRTIEWEEPNA